MAQRSRSRLVRRRNRRLSRYFVYLAYAGTVVVALAQVIAALGQIVDFLDRLLGAMGQGAMVGMMVGMDGRPCRAVRIRSPAMRLARAARRGHSR